MRTPLYYFALVFVGSIVMTGYFAWELVHTGFSVIMLIFVLLFLASTILSSRDLKRFRLTAGGLAIQHLITRRTRIIPYERIEQITRSHVLEARGSPRQELLHVQHESRTDALAFLERSDRDAFLGRLEACRKGDIEGNAGQAELPRAQVVNRSDGWNYPWRRPQQPQERALR